MSRLFALLTFCLLILVQSAQAAPPDLLLILADDCTFSDLPIFGGQNARTPHIDRLASQGLILNRAYVNAAKP